MPKDLIYFTDESEEEEGEECDEECNDDFGDYVEELYTTNGVMYGTCKMTDFVNNIKCWAYNRTLDKKRVRDLIKGIKESRIVHGLFTVATIDGKYYLIDGQHRREALRRIMTTNHRVNPTVLVAIYEVESESEVVKLFKSVNNSKPLTPKETPMTSAIEIVKMLSNDYKLAIRYNVPKTTYPYLLAGDIQKRLQWILTEDSVPDRVYAEIRKLNNTYSEKRAKKIPNIRHNITDGQKLKARKSGFYLGMDEKWSWIEKLAKMIK